MNREVHVRICGGGRVKFPPATRRRSRADQGQPGANPAGEEPGARPGPKVKSSVIDKRLIVEARCEGPGQ